jgi:uncharacterized protein
VLFECSKCGLCCRDTQQKTRHILVLEKEANAIEMETSLPRQVFTKQITDKNPYYYEMKKSCEGKCFFLKNEQCSIYKVRPLICRFYPFELKFDSDKKQHVFDFTVECPGIGKGRAVAIKDFKALFSLAQERLL